MSALRDDTPEDPAPSADTDVVIVGSGAAGATVARSLAWIGARVIVVEEGPLVPHESMPADSFTAMRRFYRDAGAQVANGRPHVPMLQGRCVGGSTLMNGAIGWRLPHDVWLRWVLDDRKLGDDLPWEEIERATDTVERDLEVAPTDGKIAGRKNLLMAKAAATVGLEGRPTRRNVRDCEGLGRCLQGCPKGHKLSMDVSYLPDAQSAGAKIWARCRVDRIETENQRAVAVAGVRTDEDGRERPFEVNADRAVVVAASAIQSPALLRRSGIKHGPVGDGLMAHPGVSVAGRFDEPVRMWQGATQGYEVIGLRDQGLKFEALGYGAEILAMRLPGVGRDLAGSVAALDRWLDWGAAIRAEARGRVRPAGPGRVRIDYQVTPGDVARIRRGLRVLGDLLLAAGAHTVSLGVHGVPETLESRKELARFEHDGPSDPRAYKMAASHLFGTCRMGSRPETSVVRTDFRHHTVENLYVVDSSVFPSNTGVNPQNSIVALATLAAQRIAK